jgi:hypothetical protein
MTLAEQEHRNLAARLHHQAMIKEVEAEQGRERAQDEYERRLVRKSLDTLEFTKEWLLNEDRLADYFHNLALKYGRAASSPWETAGPDPPPPRLRASGPRTTASQ